MVVPLPEGDLERDRFPSFSVIIAAYQAAGTVGEAVASALSQTLPPLEVIVCDDGSTDDIEGALSAYRERIVLFHKRNGGEGSAKNTAARAASGDFVVILDADDVFLPERLEALAELASARPDLDVLTTNAFLDLGGRTVARYYPDIATFPVDEQRRRILEDSCAIFGLAAVRRDRLLAFGGFDEEMTTSADWECWMRLAVSGVRFGLVDEPLARYRLGPDSLTADKVKEWRGCVMALEKVAALPGLGSADRATLRRSLVHHRCQAMLTEAEASLRRGSADSSRRALSVALGRGFGMPTRVKAVTAALAPRTARRILLRREKLTGRSRLARVVGRGA